MLIRKRLQIQARLCVAALVVLVAWPASAAPARQARFVHALDRMMLGFGAHNADTSAAIRDLYRDYLELLVLEGYDEMEDALGNGGLVRLPDDPERFNVALRLEGPHPIGEKDLDNQINYLSARPATIGCLLDVASRVKSGPLEVTSLVRHIAYQDELKSTNVNAITSVPMHTMGLAFDIALLNTPLETVYEIRDVLRQMHEAGDILVIGERRQLVFHVVPHPARLGYFTGVYADAIGSPATFAPTRADAPGTRDLRTPPVAAVTAEVVAVTPTEEFVEQWWAADPGADLTIEVVAAATAALPASTPLLVRAAAFPTVTFAAGLLAVIWRAVARRSILARRHLSSRSEVRSL